jgi:hypothetical protein
VDDDAIRTLVTRLSRPHASGGAVIERAAILAEGADAGRCSHGSLPMTGNPRLEQPDA